MSGKVYKTDTAERDKFLCRFAPEAQVMFCRNEELALFGNAPTLRKVSEIYGAAVARSWLEIQINDLSEFAGCRDKISPARCRELAGMMAIDFPHYRLTEFMLFFQRFKRCAYGKFYGSVDPMIINAALLDFDRERSQAIRRRKAEDESLKQRREEAEYEAIRSRYRARIPMAFTDEAPVDFLQYHLMNFESLTDAELAGILERIGKGILTLPTSAPEMLEQAFSDTNRPQV